MASRAYSVYLHAVVYGKTEAETAKCLGLSTSAVSRCLAALEKEYPMLPLVRHTCRQVSQREQTESDAGAPSVMGAG